MRVVILISADSEWKAALAVAQPASLEPTPYGDCFAATHGGEPVLFLHGGWGKVAAAASAEYAIGRWDPELILNLGTCGGIEGRVTLGTRILVTRTVIYDIHEAMGDASDALDAYATTIDLEWLGPSLPVTVTRAPLYSADADLVPAMVEGLMRREGAVAADWESGAIAFVANRRRRRLLVIREVSDLVSPREGEVVANFALFERRVAAVMRGLLGDLDVLIPFLLARLEAAPAGAP